MQHNEEFTKASKYLMHLVRCGLKQEKARVKPQDVSWELIHGLAKKNSIEGVSFYGLENISETVPKSIYNVWKSERDRICYHVLSFDEERNKIFSKMRQNKISFLPLKGIILNRYYPKPGMRSMIDNDILYGCLEKNDNGIWQNVYQINDQNFFHVQKIVQSIMIERGYKTVSLKGNHDIYTKPPFFSFEMHKELVSQGSQFYTYYANAWGRAKNVEGDNYLFEFTAEEEYIFIIVHAFKHVNYSGLGVRVIVDIYVYLNALGDQLDFEYINKQLTQLGIKDFESSIRNLSEKIFVLDEALSLDEEELLNYLVSSGTHGDIQTRVINDINKLKKNGKNDVQARLQYICSRFFLPAGLYSNYPIVKKYKVLILVLPFYRLIKGMVFYRKALFKEIKEVLKKH